MRTLLVCLMALATFACADSPLGPSTVSGDRGAPSAAAVNSTGYNETALLFNGPADLADGIEDGLFYGDPVFANDQLIIKANREYQRGVLEGWSDPSGYDATSFNQWNGKRPGNTTGNIWHYQAVWDPACALPGQPVTAGYCQDERLRVITSHGTIENQHIWVLKVTRATERVIKGE